VGIYQYTLRAATKRVDGIEIGQFKFAYKHGSYYPGPREAATIARLERGAQRAADKLNARGVQYFTAHPHEYASDAEGIPIYWSESLFPEYTEQLRTTPRAGTLRKVGGKYRATWAADALIGELCRDGRPLFYVIGADAEPAEFATREAAATFARAEWQRLAKSFAGD
jgi:hypothetical protein